MPESGNGKNKRRLKTADAQKQLHGPGDEGSVFQARVVFLQKHENFFAGKIAAQFKTQSLEDRGKTGKLLP